MAASVVLAATGSSCTTLFTYQVQRQHPQCENVAWLLGDIFPSDKCLFPSSGPLYKKCWTFSAAWRCIAGTLLCYTCMLVFWSQRFELLLLLLWFLFLTTVIWWLFNEFTARYRHQLLWSEVSFSCFFIINDSWFSIVIHYDLFIYKWIKMRKKHSFNSNHSLDKDIQIDNKFTKPSTEIILGKKPSTFQ